MYKLIPKVFSKKYFPLFLPKTNLKQNYHKIIYHEPFPRPHISDSSELLEFVDNNFKFDKNGRKFSCRIENTVEKEKLLIMTHIIFKRLLLQTNKNQGLLKLPFTRERLI